MADDKITVPILFGEKEELYTITVTPEQYKQILDGNQNILQKFITEEREKRSVATIQQFANFNDCNQDLDNLKTMELVEGDDFEEIQKEVDDAKETTFTWPEKAVMLFVELYHEREHEFTTRLKRHNKIWSEIAFELQKSNYNVSSVQVQNKMSSLKRTYKKIKDSNAKSGNHNSSWAFYSVMESLFGDKSWVSPPAVASSDGSAAPSALSSPSSSSSSLACQSSSQSPFVDNFEYQDISSSKPKKRRVEVILDSFISDIKSNKDQTKEGKRTERLEREEKKEKRWKINREERRQMHMETSDIQKSLVNLLSKLVEKQNEFK